MMHGLACYSYFAAAIMFAATAAVVLRHQSTREQAPYLIAACIVTSIWAGLSASYAGGVIYHYQLVAISEVIRNFFWAVSILQLIGATQKPARLKLFYQFAQYGFGVIATILCFTALFIKAQWQPGGSGIYAKYTFTGDVIVCIMILGLLEQLYKGNHNETRWGLKFLCFGIAGIALFDTLMYGTGLVAAAISHPVWEVRGAWTAALAPLLLFGVFKHQRWVRDIQPSQQMIFHATLTLLGACCFTVLIAIANIIDGFMISFADHVSVFVLAIGSLGIGFALSSERLRTSLAIWVAKNCFKFRYDYRLEWEQLTKMLDQQDSGISLQQRMCKALARLTHSPGGCLYLFKEKQYQKYASWGEHTNQFSNEISSALLAQHQFHLEPFLFVDHVFWCGVPLSVQNECIGIIILAKPYTAIDFNWEVKDFLNLAGKQVATYLHQAEQAKALTVAKQFEAVHKVSTFVAHDLKNIVSIVGTIQSNAKTYGDNPEFIQSVYRSLAGIHEQVQSLLIRIEQPEQQRQLFAWLTVVKYIQELFKHSKPELIIRGATEQWKNIQLKGDAKQFVNILSHLIKNAQQATLDHHAVYLDIEYDAPQLIIRVIDQGCGMSADFMQNSLFEPFVSTKGTMGIGVYQAKQVIESMGGEIAVQSNPHQGTQFTLRLPVAYSQSLVREQEIL